MPRQPRFCRRRLPVAAGALLVAAAVPFASPNFFLNPIIPTAAAQSGLNPVLSRQTTVQKRSGGQLSVQIDFNTIERRWRFAASEPPVELELQTGKQTSRLTVPPNVWLPAEDWEGESSLVFVAADGSRVVAPFPLEDLRVLELDVSPKHPLPGDVLDIAYVLSRTPPTMPPGQELSLRIALTKDESTPSTTVVAVDVPLTARRGRVAVPMPPNVTPQRLNVANPGLSVRAAFAGIPAAVEQGVAALLPWRGAVLTDAAGQTFRAFWKNPSAPPETVVAYNPQTLSAPPPGTPQPDDAPEPDIVPVSVFFHDETAGPGVHTKQVLYVRNGRPRDVVVIRRNDQIMHVARLERLRRRHPAPNAETLPVNHYFLDWCWFGSVTENDAVTLSVLRETDDPDLPFSGRTIPVPYAAIPPAARYAARYLAQGRIPLHNQTANPSDPLTVGGSRFGDPSLGEAVPGVHHLRFEDLIDANHARLSWRANLIDYAAQGDELTRLRADEALAPEAFVCSGGAFVAPPVWTGDRWTAVVSFSPLAQDANGVRAGHADVRIELAPTENGQPVNFACPHAAARWIRDFNPDRRVRIELDPAAAPPFGAVRGRVWTAPDADPTTPVSIAGQLVPHQPGAWTPFAVSVSGDNRDMSPYAASTIISAAFDGDVSQAACETPNFRPNAPYVAPPNGQNYYQMLPESAFSPGDFPVNRYVFRRYFPTGKRSGASHHLTVVNSFAAAPWQTGNPFPYFTLARPTPTGDLEPAPVDGGWHFAQAAYTGVAPIRGFVYWSQAVRTQGPGGPIRHYYLPIIDEDEDPADQPEGCPQLIADVAAEPTLIPADLSSVVVVSVRARAFDYGLIEGGDQLVHFETNGDFAVPIGPGVNPRRLRVRLVREGCQETVAVIDVQRRRLNPSRLAVDAPPAVPDLGPNQNGRYWSGDHFPTGQTLIRQLAAVYQLNYGQSPPPAIPLPERTGAIHLTQRPHSGVNVALAP